MYEVTFRLSDDDTGLHEQRRIVLDAWARGANLLREPEEEKPLRIFRDHKNPIFLRQLLAAHKLLGELWRRANVSASAHKVKPAVAKQQGITGADLDLIERESGSMAIECDAIAKALSEAHGIVFRWFQELLQRNKALAVGVAALTAASQPESTFIPADVLEE